jgi:plasmid stabilization system protein ParE
VTPPFTRRAEEQFFAALAHIHLATVAFRYRAARALERLGPFPKSGRRLAEFPNRGLREVIVPPYRFFYRIVRGEPVILAVWHSAQQPARPKRG